MLQRQRELIAVGIFFLVLTWFTVSLRVYTRAILMKKWGHDDSAIIVTLGLFTLSVIVQILSVVHGVGHHPCDLSTYDARAALFYCYLYEILYVLVGVGLKIALGMFYLRIAIERWQILVIKFIVIGTAVFGVACLFLVVLQCIPVSSFWLVYPANDQCIPKTAQNGITFTLNAMNACADWVLGTLPFFIVKNLRLSFVTKMLVAGILAFAAVGSTATIVRMKYVEDLTNGPEFLYVIIDVSLWSTVEPGIGITAVSIATLRPLLQTLLWRLGYVPAPTYNVPRPLGSRDGISDVQHGLGWFRPRHQTPSLAPIESSTSTTATAARSNQQKKGWFPGRRLKKTDLAQELANDGLRPPTPSV